MFGIFDVMNAFAFIDIARYAGATAAQEVARMFALQWHQDGLTPYIIFEGKTGEDPAFFRRLFKRTTGVAPGAYRKRFRIPDFALPPYLPL